MLVASVSVVGGIEIVDRYQRALQQQVVGAPTVMPVAQTVKPQFASAQLSELQQEDRIAGISLNGEVRAYALGKMTQPADHIVNDVMQGIPVCMTYNSIHDTARAFAANRGADSMNLTSAGLTSDSKLLLKADDHLYDQHTGQALHPDAPPFPYEELQVCFTTWGEWRAEHPESKVYVGSESMPFLLNIQQSPETIGPEYVAVESAELAGEERVAAINLNGEVRAYVLKGMVLPTEHIVSDIIQGVPISITYCNIHDCVRAYLAEQGSEPLKLSVAGVTKESMLLKADGHIYEQRSGKRYEADAPSFPYSQLDVSVTTWSEWSAAHPQGLVYIGPQNPSHGPDMEQCPASTAGQLPMGMNFDL